jgi:hypothetical protein
LAITSPTSGGRSVDIVRSRTQTMEFVCLYQVATPELFVFIACVFSETVISNDGQMLQSNFQTGISLFD